MKNFLTIEHQVLKQVSKAGAALGFVLWVAIQVVGM